MAIRKGSALIGSVRWGATLIARVYHGATLIHQAVIVPVGPFFSDDFNRANEFLESSPNWTMTGGTAGGLRVEGNALRIVQTADGQSYKCPDIGLLDHSVEAYRSQAGAADYFLCCRLQDHNNFVGVRYWQASSKWSIYKRVAGTFTDLASVTTPVPPCTVKLEVEGSTARMYLNGALVLTAALGAHTSSTRAGFVPRNHAANPAFDNFIHDSL